MASASVELYATFTPHISASVRMDGHLGQPFISASVQMQATIHERITASVALLATIRNQNAAAAAADHFLFPVAEISAAAGIKPIQCRIDSNLDAFADAITLECVERDEANPITPKLSLWRTLARGSMIRVKLGLKDVGYDDYGVYRVDTIDTDQVTGISTIRARDLGALAIDESAANPYDDGQPQKEQPLNQSTPSSAIARVLCAQAGLGIDNGYLFYSVHDFRANARQSVSAALAQLLEPLRQAPARRADAWIESRYDEALEQAYAYVVIRKRFSGDLVGTIDCTQGQVRACGSRTLPTVGYITVDGGFYRHNTEKVPEVNQAEEAGETLSTFEVEEQGNVRRTSTGTLTESGEYIIVSQEVETQEYTDVYGDDNSFLGRILKRTIIEQTNNPGQSGEAFIRREITFGHDTLWRVILKDERARQRNSTGGMDFLSHAITVYEQATPTDHRVTTKSLDENGAVLSTSWEQQPGHLQSALTMTQDPSGVWAIEGDAPTGDKEIENLWQFTSDHVTYFNDKLKTKYSEINGGGSITVEYSNPMLYDFSVCGEIANSIDADSGQKIYAIRLFWPRPFPYRKGQRVILTNLPDGLASLYATITALVTTFDEAAGEWVHDISFEALA